MAWNTGIFDPVNSKSEAKQARNNAWIYGGLSLLMAIPFAFSIVHNNVAGMAFSLMSFGLLFVFAVSCAYYVYQHNQTAAEGDKVSYLPEGIVCGGASNPLLFGSSE